MISNSKLGSQEALKAGMAKGDVWEKDGLYYMKRGYEYQCTDDTQGREVSGFLVYKIFVTQKQFNAILLEENI